MSTPGVATPATISHRYPWSGEEKGIIAFFLLAPLVAAGIVLATGGRPGLVLLVLGVIGWAVAAGLVVLGRRRKNASRVTATLTGSKLAVQGGRVKKSRGDLSAAVSATTTQMGPETVLVVELVEGSVLVPGRLVGDPSIAALLDAHLVKGDVPLSDGARELLGV